MTSQTTTVPISNKLISTLHYYKKINDYLVIRKGNIIRTLNRYNGIAATYTHSHSFPVDFGIYNLPKFINALSLYENPYLVFDLDEPKSVKIIYKNDSVDVTYALSSIELLEKNSDTIKWWDKINSVSKFCCSFTVDNNSIKKWIHYANAFNANKIRFKDQANDKISITIYSDEMNSIQDNYIECKKVELLGDKLIYNSTIDVDSIKILHSAIDHSYKFILNEQLVTVDGMQEESKLKFYIATK